MFDVLKNEVDNWGNPTLTTLELKELLIEAYPDFYWRQSVISAYMAMTGLPYSDNGTFRTYMVNTRGMYYSKSKETWIPIKDMNTVHIQNTILKHYMNYTVQSVVAEIDGTLNDLLRELLNR